MLKVLMCALTMHLSLSLSCVCVRAHACTCERVSVCDRNGGNFFIWTDRPAARMQLDMRDVRVQSAQT